MPIDHKATSQQLLELWGDNAVHMAADFLSEDYVNHQMPDAAGGTSSKSLEQWKALVNDFHQCFSDVQIDILLQVAEGDYVCSRWRLTGTNTGNFRTAQSTGKTTSWTGVHTDRYEGDKLVESWVEWDMMSCLRGLGLAE